MHNVRAALAFAVAAFGTGAPPSSRTPATPAPATLRRAGLRGLVLVLGVLGVAAVPPATAVAAPTLAPGAGFSFLAPGEFASETGLGGVAAAPTGGDVWAAGAVFAPEGEEGSFARKDVIRRFSPSGAILQTIPDPSPPRGDNKVSYRQIYDLGVRGDGGVLYVPAERNDGGERTSLGVLRLDAGTGAVLGSFASPGSGPGAAEFAGSVSVDPGDGDVYVRTGSASGPGLKRFSAEGVFEVTSC